MKLIVDELLKHDDGGFSIIQRCLAEKSKLNYSFIFFLFIFVRTFLLQFYFLVYFFFQNFFYTSYYSTFFKVIVLNWSIASQIVLLQSLNLPHHLTRLALHPNHFQQYHLYQYFSFILNY